MSLAYNAYVTATERNVALKQYVDSSTAARDAYAKQFSIGQRTLLDLLNAENELFNSRLTYVTGQYTEVGATYRLFSGMGKLLEVLQVAPPAESLADAR